MEIDEGFRAASNAVDAKAVDAALVKRLAFVARWGSGGGTALDGEELRRGTRRSTNAGNPADPRIGPLGQAPGRRE